MLTGFSPVIPARMRYTLAMQRIFRPYDYDAALDQTFRVGDLLPADHPARQLVAFLAPLELTELYDLYYPIGAHPYDPRVLLALWIYGYQHGICSSRKLAQAITEQVPFMYLSGGIRPVHTVLAEFRTLVMIYLPTLFAEVLTQAKQAGHLTMEAVSHDGTKIHADASKHQAVSYERADDIIQDLQQQIDDLLQRAREAPATLPPALDLAEEILLRQARIARLQDARQVLEARAAARYQTELAAYQEQLAARAERERVTGKKPGGKPPAAPTPAPAPKDQYNFTDPDSRIMKNSTNQGFDQHYNSQVTVEHASRLIVGCEVSPHPNDTQEALPSLETIPPTLGHPAVANLDHGFWNPQTVSELQARGITPLIAVGKTVHGLNWERYYATSPADPPRRMPVRRCRWPISYSSPPIRRTIGRANPPSNP